MVTIIKKGTSTAEIQRKIQKALKGKRKLSIIDFAGLLKSEIAYSSQSTFTGRSFGEHLGMFAAGGFYGSLSAEAFKGKWGGIRASDTPKGWRALMGATAVATDYSIGALIKGRTYGNFYSGQSQKNKGGIFGLKYLAFSFSYLGY